MRMKAKQPGEKIAAFKAADRKCFKYNKSCIVGDADDRDFDICYQTVQLWKSSAPSEEGDKNQRFILGMPTLREPYSPLHQDEETQPELFFRVVPFILRYLL
ncbi:hypothetical protein G5I_11023 [Acromyrmex echinatior]|uniref:Uncharacterized protein n=1 Tax=Acromyrmex echinatior TaxID=103372 RepID=F4WYH2_ACREC|nr:hypothetical protein G5I_11023 [Acromyrmex echinatior]